MKSNQAVGVGFAQRAGPHSWTSKALGRGGETLIAGAVDPQMCCWRQLGRTPWHGTVEREGLSSPLWAVGPIVCASQLKLPWRRKEQGCAAYVSVNRCDQVWDMTVGEYVCEGAHECVCVILGVQISVQP